LLVQLPDNGAKNSNFEGGLNMSVLGWILFGLVVGIVGKLLMPGRDPGGFILTILLGIAGALVGGFIGQSLGLYQPGEPAGFVMAVIGSIILLLIYRLVVGRRTY
jgi:uncharacterized membrane protein YeaQ/YmgE (transglycosylase-associated protein family)